MSGQQYFMINVFSHHFVITQVQARGQDVVESFARQYIQFGLVKEGRRFIRAPVKVFAARVRGSLGSVMEYRFHIEQLDAFMKHLTNMQILPHTYEIVRHDPHPGAEVVLNVLEKWTPKDYQEPIIEYLTSDTPSRAKLLEIQTGKGKGQPHSAKIKTPGGWTTMGEIQVGDTLTAWDGSPTKVTGVFPQGLRETYKVVFADSRSTEVDGNHLWKLRVIDTNPVHRWRVVNTMELIHLLSLPQTQLFVSLVEFENGVAAELPVQPFTLGTVLKDACLIDDEAIVSKEDAALLGDLGLVGIHSWEKFIPEVYLHGSAHQRLRLLQGLLGEGDADETTQLDNHITYCTDSWKLAEQVQYLVRSLGGIVSISVQKPIDNIVREAYLVSIRFKKQEDLLDIVPKIEEGEETNRGEELHLQVTSVTPLGVQQTQCISIDHPDHLYITDDFIVTHNTFCAASAIAHLNRRFVVILKPMYIDKWKSDLKEILGLHGHDVIVVQGSAQLMNLITTAKEGELQAKAIIISNKTLQNWYSLYEKNGAHIDDLGYDCRPAELFSVLDVGVRLIDEVHQDFHLNFKIDLYTHVAKAMSLSATLKGDDPFLNRMYEVAYPKNMRYAGLAYDKYINAFSWMYQVNDPAQLRTTEWGSTTYSHHAFEKSVIRNKRLLHDYLDMISKTAVRFHFEHYKKGERLLIYCASIQMCTLVVEYLRTEFKGIDVRRYVEDDPYENVMEADVSVSTLLSAGTGLDIPMLTTVILTTAISSSQSNIQGFGRLRKIADKRLQFVYFACQDVPKHLEYHEKKKEMLKHMAQSYDSVNYHHLLGS